VPSLRAIFLIDPDSPRVVVWSRADETSDWADVEVNELVATIAIEGAAISLALSEIYEDVSFEADDAPV